jgi:hypothetical protein
MNYELIGILSDFNSKERFFLVGHVLGNPSFKIGSQFRTQLSSTLNLTIPEDLFCAMDYHIDWLYAALQLNSDKVNKRIYLNENSIIKAQQEDIDLLIAYKAQGIYHLILIEAKATTGWSNKQMESKITRMIDIFGVNGAKWAGVIPHFVLMSPRPPQRLNTSGLPNWIIPNKKWPWISLKIPDDLKRVTRCNSDEKQCAKGTYWKVVNR